MAKPILIDFNGMVACLAEHCRHLGISVQTVINRHRRTKEPYEKCLEHYAKNGVRHVNRSYKIQDKRLYSRWYDAKDRCENPKNHMYKYYGERGIKVCERWQAYENFENDMLESFLEHVEKFGLKDTQLDRVDYDGNYEPLNCEWKTHKEQQNNKSNNVMITEELNASQFAEKYNLNPRTVLSRIRLGWSIEKIINTPVKQYRKSLLPCGKKLPEHCKQNGYNYNNVRHYMYKYNLTPDKALAKYLEKRNKK